MAEKDGNGNGSVIGSGTVDGMLAFLDFLVAKGYAKAPAVNPLKAVVSAVFKTTPDDKSVFDVRTFDADEFMDRFENRALGKYKQESLASYRQRLKRAVAAYREYLDDGNVSVISTKARAPRPRKGASSVAKAAYISKTKGNGNGNGHADVPVHDVTASLIDYPFPLRSGQVAHLRLPMKLEKADADRLAGFLRTLVFEPQLEIPAETGAAT